MVTGVSPCCGISSVRHGPPVLRLGKGGYANAPTTASRKQKDILPLVSERVTAVRVQNQTAAANVHCRNFIVLLLPEFHLLLGSTHISPTSTVG